MIKIYKYINSQGWQTVQKYTNDTAFVYNSNFYDVGNFTLQLPNSQVYDIHDGYFIKFKDKLFIVKYYTVEADYCTIKGYDLKGLLKQRVVHPNTWTGKPEKIIKDIVRENTTGNRAFPNFSVSSVSPTTADSVEFVLEKSATLSDVVNELCEKYNIGYDIIFSQGNNAFSFIFVTKTPTERDVSYSIRNGNYTSYNYTYDALSKANVIYNRAERVGMEVSTTVEYSNVRYGTITVSAGTVYFPSGASYTTTTDTVISSTWDSHSSQWFVYAYHNITNNTYGVDRYNIIPSQSGYEYVVLAHIASGNGIVTQRDIAPVITSRYKGSTEPTGYSRCETIGNETNGNEEIDRLCNDILFQNDVKESLNAEIINNDDYGKNWFLGDYINITINTLNEIITQSMQVTGLQQSWEDGKYNIAPTFGEERKNIIKQILRKI